MEIVIEKQCTESSETMDRSSKGDKCSIRRKDLVCTVCGASATGFNFSVITCMCCKAFFRRNALFGLQALQCRYSTENCVINSKSRRDCSYCRLKKCFDVGMKKELILSDDLKRVKREKILANRQMTLNSLRPLTFLCFKQDFQLKESELSYLTNIYNAYEEYCRLPLVEFDKNKYDALAHQPIKERIKVQHYYQYYGKSESYLTSFFSRLPEFKELPTDQQLILTKQNARFILRISLVETITDQMPLWPAINLVLERIFGQHIVETSTTVLRIFKHQINDPTSIRLLLIILLFSTSNITTGYIDTLHIYQIQVKYIELLWLYLKQRYSELRAYETFSILIRHCLHLQMIGHEADMKREELERQNLFLAIHD